MKKICISLSLITTFLLSGCGDTNDSCRLKVQQDLDSGNFDAVIRELNVTSCQNEFDNREYLISLGAAYMGKSGLGFSEVIDILVNQSNSSGDESFSTFIKDVNAKTANNNTHANLQSSQDVFVKFLPSLAACQKPDDYNLSFAQKDVCLFMSLTQTLSATNLLSSLTSNIDAWLGSAEVNASDDLNKNETPDDVDANSFAIAYSDNGKDTPSKSISLTHKDNNKTIGTHQYELIELSVFSINDNNDTNNTFASLIFPNTPNIPGRYKVFTQGYCKDVNVTIACASYNALEKCMPCPVLDKNGAPVSLNDTLVDSLNGGLDGTAAVSNDKAIDKSIKDFKKELRTDSNNSDANITITDVVNYLNTPKKK